MNYKVLSVVVLCSGVVGCFSAVTTPPGSTPVVVLAAPPLTMENYDKIQMGMTLREVEGILGPPVATGNHDEKTPEGSKRVVDSASWLKFALAIPVAGGEAKQPEACRIVVELKDGKVMSKSQTGLK